MSDLAHELFSWRGRRVCVLGAGSAGRGDDGFGVRLAQALAPRLAGGPARAVDVGTCPERFVGEAAAEGFEAVVFADAARFDAAPGTLLFAATDELLARPPAAATHRVPLAVLAQYAEGLGMRAFLLGVAPERLEGTALSPAVEGTLRAVTELLAEALGPDGSRSCFDKLSTSGSASARPEPVEGRAADGGEATP